MRRPRLTPTALAVQTALGGQCPEPGTIDTESLATRLGLSVLSVRRARIRQHKRLKAQEDRTMSSVTVSWNFHAGDEDFEGREIAPGFWAIDRREWEARAVCTGDCQCTAVAYIDGRPVDFTTRWRDGSPVVLGGAS